MCHVLAPQKPTARNWDPDLWHNFSVHTDGIKVLGAFIGSDDFQINSIKTKIIQDNDKLQKLRKAKTMGVAPQGLMQIATRSVNATSTFVMRTHSPDITRGPIEELDKLMVSLAGEIMLTSLDSREAIAQLKLPIKMGGAGIGYATRLRSACYVASLIESNFGVLQAGGDILDLFEGPMVEGAGPPIVAQHLKELQD